MLFGAKEVAVRLIIQSVLNRFAMHPLRGVLSVFSMALGAAAVTLVLNLSFRFDDAVEAATESIASVMVIANATVEDGGSSTSWSGAGDFTGDTVDALRREFPQLTALVPMSAIGTSFEIRVDDEYYRLRRVIPTTPEYRELYRLEMLAGSFITRSDVERKAQVVAIGEDVATVLFGGAEEAVGNTITQVRVSGPSTSQTSRVFTVTGVFEQPEYQQQLTQGIGDVVVPESLYRRAGADRYRVIVGRLEGIGFDEAKPKVEAIMRSIVGEDTPVAVWQGRPSGPQRTGMIEAMTSSIRSVSVFFGALGMIALLVSAFGMFSSTLVSILERTREIGLRRSLGSTRAGIILHFTVEALIMTAVGVAVGVAIAAVFNGPVIAGVRPMFSFGRGEVLADMPVRPGLDSIAAGGLLSLAVGTLLGMIPAVSAARVSPMESLREQ